MNEQQSNEARALITLPSRTLVPTRRWLPAPISRRAAVITAVGAASAVGTFFLKRLGELVAEDLYRRFRHQPVATAQTAPTRYERSEPTDNSTRDEGTLLVRLFSVQRVVSGPYYRQRLRIRQGRFGSPPEPTDEAD